MKHTLLISILIVVIATLGTITLELKIRATQIQQQRVRIEQEKWNVEQAERAKQEAKAQEAARQKAAYDAKKAYDATPAGKAANLKACLATAEQKLTQDCQKLNPPLTAAECKKKFNGYEVGVMMVQWAYSHDTEQCQLRYGS